MEIVVEEINNVFVMKLIGRLDISCSSDLKDRVISMIREKKINLLIDMSEVSFVDSSGLGMLVTCLHSVKRAGGSLKITSFRENPRYLFETTRLDRVFEIYDDRGEAIKSFKS